MSTDFEGSGHTFYAGKGDPLGLKRDSEGEDSLRIPAVRLNPDYMAELWKEAERIGAVDHMPAKSKSVFKARVLAGEIQSARRAWALARLSGSAFPPPFARIRDRDDYTWLMFGRLVRKHKPELYHRLLTALTDFVKPKLESVQALRTLSRKYTLGDVLDNWLAAELGEEEHEWLQELGEGNRGR